MITQTFSFPSFSRRGALALALALPLAACGDDGGQSSAGSGDTTTGASTTTSGATTASATMDSGSSGAGQSSDSSSGTTDSTQGSEESTGSTGTPACEQASFDLPGEDFYPEGVAGAEDGTLYIASLGTGAVVRTIPCALDPEVVVEAGGPLRNPVGMIVDEGSDRLIVCDSDLSFMSPPSIDVFDRHSGELVASHEFDAVGFCNDLALDAAGNIYATDSGGARVLRVAAAALERDTPAETWAADGDFAVGMGEFGLNGIAFDGQSSLYVANFEQGELHRIEIDDDGEAGAITPIALEGGALQNPDGMKWVGDSTLLVVEGGLGALSRVELDGDTGTSAVIRDGFDFPTTFAVGEQEVWLAEGQLDHLFGFDPEPPAPPFVVTRVSLE